MSTRSFGPKDEDNLGPVSNSCSFSIPLHSSSMGQANSTAYATNHYQLVCECSVELEQTLKRNFGATGHGLGDLYNSVKHKLPASTLQHLGYVTRQRNKKAHELKAIDRAKFIWHFEQARDELQALLKPKTSVVCSDTGSSDGTGPSPGLTGGLVLGGLLAAAGAIALAASKRDDDDDQDKEKRRH